MRTLSFLGAILVATTIGWVAGFVARYEAMEVALWTAVVVLYADPQWTWELPELLDR